MQTLQRNRAFVRLGSSVFIYGVLGVGLVIYLYPMVWMVLNSLKSTPEIFRNPWSLPTEWLWDNYAYAWTSGKTGLYLFNSAWVTSISLLLVVLISSMGAFSLRILKWKGSGIMLVYFLIGMMVPVHATLIPLFIFFTNMQMVNSHTGLILLYSAFALPAAILILYGFFGSIPRDLIEAAIIDGSGMLNVYWKVVLPISLPALMTVVIFSFVSIWNELLVALVFMSDVNKMTLPVGLTNFSQQYSTDYASLFAATFLAALPSVIIYSFFNNRIISGMTSGAIKG